VEVLDQQIHVFGRVLADQGADYQPVLGVQGDVVPAVAAAVVVGVIRSQCFSFLVTNDHFSSNWTSCVAGGKSHELVVELLGVRAGQQAVADDGVLVHADQARGLADADAFGDVAQDGDDLSWGSWAPCSGVPLRSEKRALQVLQRSRRRCWGP